MEFKDLIGKKITDAKIQRLSNHDDFGYLKLNFSDGSECVIMASYDFYTGNSLGEYPTAMSIVEKFTNEDGETLVDVDTQEPKPNF